MENNSSLSLFASKIAPWLCIEGDFLPSLGPLLDFWFQLQIDAELSCHEGFIGSSMVSKIPRCFLANSYHAYRMPFYMITLDLGSSGECSLMDTFLKEENIL